MKQSHKVLAAALLAAGTIVSQSAVAGYHWDSGCGCQRAVEYVQPYVQQPAVVSVLRPRVVYRPQVVYEAVPAYVMPAPAVYAHGCGSCARGLFTGSYGYGYGHHVHYGHYGAGYAGYDYGPTD